MRMGIRLLLITAVLTTATTAFSQDDSGRAEDLKEIIVRLEKPYNNLSVQPFWDIGPVGLLVEYLPELAQKAGITDDELEAFVELKLQQSGIPMRDVDDKNLESPYVYVNVTLMHLKLPYDFVAYSIEVSLNQRIVLPRYKNLPAKVKDPSNKLKLMRRLTSMTASTWDKSILGIVPRNRVGSKIKDNIGTLLTFFIDEYLKANPGSVVSSR